MGNWKGIRYASKSNLEEPRFAGTQLYNLKADIGETINIANQHPEIVAKIEEYMKTAHTPSQLFPLL